MYDALVPTGTSGGSNGSVKHSWEDDANRKSLVQGTLDRATVHPKKNTPSSLARLVFYP